MRPAGIWGHEDLTRKRPQVIGGCACAGVTSSGMIKQRASALARVCVDTILYLCNGTDGS